MAAKPGRYTVGRAMTDVRSAINRKIAALRNKVMTGCPHDPTYAVGILDELKKFVSTYDDRAKARKGGPVKSKARA